jgi:hypothetical protein
VTVFGASGTAGIHDAAHIPDAMDSPIAMTPTPAPPAPNGSPFHFCTYFDRNYLSRGLALYHSLRRHCRRPFLLWILCFDDESYAVLRRLDLAGIRPIRRRDFEAGDSELAAARADRNLVEYYWTCTPSLPLYLFNHHSDIELITYLDADLFFFGDPLPIYDEFAGQSILIHAHRYAPEYAYNEDTAGIFNVGLMAFRRDAAGLECLRWWRARCNEWCYARHEDGKFGDQKYLDDWPERFPRVHVLQHPGAGLAPWNIGRYRLSFRGADIRVDGFPLIFFHFHALKLQSRWLIMPSCEGYRIPGSVMAGIYAPYLESLLHASQAGGMNFADPTGANTQPNDWRSSAQKVLRQELWFNGVRPLARALWYLGGKRRALLRSYASALHSWRQLANAAACRHRDSQALLLSAISRMQESNRRTGGAIISRAVASSPPILLTRTFGAAAARYLLGNARFEAWKRRVSQGSAAGN